VSPVVDVRGIVWTVRLDKRGGRRAVACERGGLRRLGLARRLMEPGPALEPRRKDGEAMSKLIMCAALAWVGLFGCMDAQRPEPEEATSESELLICCADFTCAATGFETTGCVHGTPNITQARAACTAACGVPCATSGTYCTE
jgi:hypothetical protein